MDLNPLRSFPMWGLPSPIFIQVAGPGGGGADFSDPNNSGIIGAAVPGIIRFGDLPERHPLDLRSKKVWMIEFCQNGD